MTSNPAGSTGTGQVAFLPWYAGVLSRRPLALGGLVDPTGFRSGSEHARPGGPPVLHRHLTLRSLVSLGVGSVVGAGIFVLTGQAAAQFAGPALSLSFIVSSVACFLTGLCYAELASSLTGVGSAYLYAYTFIGELPAFLVAQCITLEYAVAASAVAVGWSASLQALLAEFGCAIPSVLAQAPFIFDSNTGVVTASGAIFDFPAALIIAFLTGLMSLGVRESATLNHIAVGLKLSVLSIFVAYAVYYAVGHPTEVSNNLTPFVPPNTGRYGEFGVSGVFRGAGAIFFAYVGFDCLCQMTGECKDPSKDLPKSLLWTLTICTSLYVTVTLALTSMVKYTLLNTSAPVIQALSHVGAPWILRVLVDVGSVAGLTSVCLVSLMSQPRLLLAAALDGMVPAPLARVHPVFRTPHVASLLSGGASMTLAALFPLDLLGELISFGTLLAFILVCVAVVLKRRHFPLMHTPFQVPFVPFVPLLGVLVCAVQLFSLPAATWRNCVIWICIGLPLYLVARKRAPLAVAGHLGMKSLAELAHDQACGRRDGEPNVAVCPVTVAEGGDDTVAAIEMTDEVATGPSMEPPLDTAVGSASDDRTLLRSVPSSPPS